MFSGFTWDIESNGLLDGSTIDYTTSPYKIRDDYKIHCIVVEEHDTGDIIAFYDGPTYIFDGRRYSETVNGRQYVLEGYTPEKYTHRPLEEFKDYVLSKEDEVEVIAHNQINFDLLCAKLCLDMPYTIDENNDTWCDKPVRIVDTMVLSKTLNPDRFGGHSLDALSEKAGLRKLAFRKEIPQQERFNDFAADMLYYCIYDNKANTKVYQMLKQEWGNWEWGKPYQLEKSVADIITRQSHRGFKFNKELAEDSIKELDELLEERRIRVEPLLPRKKATQAYMKEYIPPKIQFKKDGTHSSNIIKWVEKHNGRWIDDRNVELFGETYELPLEQEPLKTEVAATIDDSTHIKGWLVSLGWNPTEWKEKDITVDTKKQKLSQEKFEAAVDRYVAQTLESPFCDLRCEFLETKPSQLRIKLMSGKPGRPLRVRTNPSFTVGQEKELCGDLERISGDFPFVKDVVEFLTYKHRRNSILGGGLDWDDEEEAEKGYMAAVREDGRIPTPADTCGAATSRMKHKLVANIPRVSSLYGKQMRGLFGVDPKSYFQIGYDFDSLEAREEAHYCVPMSAQALTKKGWVGYEELREGDYVLGYNSKTGLKEWTKVTGKVLYKNSKTYTLTGKSHKYRATGDHRWYVNSRSSYNTYVTKVKTTNELNTGDNIICNAPFNIDQDSSKTKRGITQGKYAIDWVKRVLDMSHSERVCFLEGFMIADGYWHEHKQSPVWRWAQNPGNLFEAALTASYLVHSGNISVAFNTKDQKVKVVTLANRSHIPVQSLSIEEWGYEDVWCPQTELGTWVMRQEDCITITGNCWRYEEGDKAYCESLLQDKPNDVHTMMAKKISLIIKRAFERSPAKSVKYAATYGASAGKIAKTIGADLKTGETVFNAFWEAALPLAKLKDKLKEYWERQGGKKFILGIDGRKVPTRSPHAILNSLFQSAGVICAKRAMVIHDQLLKEHGLSVDFFEEDWRNKPFCQQLIAYHDEAQLEVSKSLVKFKMFATEEEAAEFKSTQDIIWSDIKPSPKGGFYVAYSLAGELAAKAVKQAGDYYKLNVDLTAGYMLGYNWADCH